MKVLKEKTLEYRMLKRIETLPGTAVVRSEVADLGGNTQVSRALRALVQEGKLIPIGYGVYAKTIVSRYAGKRIMADGFKQVDGSEMIYE